jgi:predicted ribosome quality control (RQC) complex YloA/Tae2 family protein
MENLFLRQVTTQLSRELAGLRLERVSGFAPLSILIEFADGSPGNGPGTGAKTGSDKGAATHKLVICLDPVLPCLLTVGRPVPAVPAPRHPDGFIKALSTALNGTTLARIEQHGRDRVARLSFARRHEQPEEPETARRPEATGSAEIDLWVELFGRRPVAVLVEGSTRLILACSHEGVRSASGRVLHTGASYLPPLDTNKTAVETLSRESLRLWTEEKSDEDLSVRLSRRIEGLSPNAALEILEDVRVHPEQDLLEQLRQRLTHIDRHFTPAVRTPASGVPSPLAGTSQPAQQLRSSQAPGAKPFQERPEGTTAPLGSLELKFGLALFPFGATAFEQDPRYRVERYSTALEAVSSSFIHLCHWYRRVAARKLEAEANVSLGRLEKLRAALADDMASAERGDRYRRTGELLLANIGAIRRGAEAVDLKDIHREGEEILRVLLDPALSPAENADRYFKKARKAKRAREVLEKRISDVERRARAIESFVSGIPMEIGPADLARLRQRLEELARATKARAAAERTAERRRLSGAGARAVARPELARARKRAAAGPESFNPRVFATSDGHTVIVGRNNRENDYVTHHLAKPDDLWFHAYGVAGSHVVLRRRGKDTPSRRAIEETASIAAYFSKARTSSAVPVIYTQKKFVSKPRGTRPGTATCAREKMVMARPVKPQVAETE